MKYKQLLKLASLFELLTMGNSNCKQPSYWGKGAAGIMFVCKEKDEPDQILLLKRAPWVAQGGTWGIAGGAVDVDLHWYNTPIQDPITDESIFLQTAEREVLEECGSLPEYTVIGKTEYEDCGFKYITYIAQVSPETKQAWNPVSTDRETDEFKWFPINDLPPNLHFGVKFTLSKM